MSTTTFHTEKVLLKLHSLLALDLCPEHPEWFSPRSYTGPGYGNADAQTFRVHAQLQHFFKRVILSADKEFSILAAEGIRSFHASQETFGIRAENEITRRVLSHARGVVQEILGPFDFAEFSTYCRFGKKAAVGLRYKESYLDNRAERMTYSGMQLQWFQRVVDLDPILNDTIKSCNTTFDEVQALTVTAVPKSYKSARIIACDTILGGFLSRGVGAVIQRRLAAVGLDITRAQQHHKRLALKASRDGSLATLDLSRASDSFTWEHIQSLLPDDWLEVLSVVRTGFVRNESDDVVPLRSYMLMGSGHTFPLQTLLFYAIVKSVVELMGSKARVYVYGDDIIVPDRYAIQCISVLRYLGFTLNTEKSFFGDSPFRESCGGDYFRGVDVRPFTPEHICTHVSREHLIALLHQWANGLLLRWDVAEVPNAYAFLVRLAAKLDKNGRVTHIPRGNPDYAGFVQTVPGVPTYTPRLSAEGKDAWVVRFKMLHMRRSMREIRNGAAYYWTWLRASWDEVVDFTAQDAYEDREPTTGTFGFEAMKGVDPQFRFEWK